MKDLCVYLLIFLPAFVNAQSISLQGALLPSGYIVEGKEPTSNVRFITGIALKTKRTFHTVGYNWTNNQIAILNSWSYNPKQDIYLVTSKFTRKRGTSVALGWNHVLTNGNIKAKSAIDVGTVVTRAGPNFKKFTLTIAITVPFSLILWEKKS